MGGWSTVINVHLFFCTVGTATPLLLAGLGGLWSERSGVINFALEGMMLMGAFAAVWGSHLTGSPWMGLACAAAAGVVLAALHAAASLHLSINQIVSAMALNILALGITGVLLGHVFGAAGASPSVTKLPRLSLPGGQVGMLSLIAVAVAVGSWVVLYRTRWGLEVRATGEDPEAAAATGVRVLRTKWACLLLSGVLAGMAGAHLSISELSQFLEGMSGGRGYMAVAAVIFGRWRPGGVVLACLFFGLAGAVGENLHGLTVGGWQVPGQWAEMLPFLVTLAVLAGLAGRSVPPAGLGRLAEAEG
ncbi:MAG: ABC transporter permease [Planctomycetes bacterium]|nr:ABC transporter permease [Planctomycetota bacterium]